MPAESRLKTNASEEPAFIAWLGWRVGKLYDLVVPVAQTLSFAPTARAAMMSLSLPPK